MSAQFERWAPPAVSAPIEQERTEAAPASPVAPAWSPFAPDPAVEPILPPTGTIPQVAPVVSVESAPPPAPEFEPAPTPEPVGAALPPPPERRSLSDDELLAVADPASSDQGTAALLDLVEQQLALRADEAQRLAEWEQQVREVAGPEAEPLVAEVRSQFTGVIPIVGAAVASVSSPLPPTVDEPPVQPALDLALADAPPPFGSTAALLPPPPVAESTPAASSVEIDSPADPWLPPPLIEPVPPPTQAVPTGPTSIEQVLAESSAGASDLGDATGDQLSEPDDRAVDHATAVTTDADLDPQIESLFGEPADDIVEGDVESGIAGATAVPVKPPVVESTGLEPTPLEQRAGRSIRLFWLWFAVNSSVVSVALGAVVLGLGMSLRQALFSVVIGIAVSFLPLGLGTLASKWSGQPTMVVSRSTFGTGGNLVPALVALITRVVWAAALLWILAVGVAEVLVGSGLFTALPRFELSLVVAGVALVIVTVLAALGFRVIAVTSAVVSAVSAVLVVGLIVLTAQYVDVSLALSVADGPPLLLLPGAVLVFSVVGLAWANSSGDLARYQAKGTVGSAALLSTAFGATIPAAALICWGAVLAASNPAVAEGLVTNPIDILGRMLPLWYPAPLIAAIALSLIAAATLAVYSAGFAILAIGVRANRPVAVLVALPLVAAAAAALALLGVDAQSLFRDVATTLAVPVAAWAGIFGAETMIRSRRVHSPSLLRSGGVYPAVRWVNLLALIAITAIGWGFTSASLAGLEWQGWAWSLLGVENASPLGGSDAGVFAALLLGLLVPIVAGIPAMRALQTAERDAAAHDDAATTGVTTLAPVTTAVPSGS